MPQYKHRCSGENMRLAHWQCNSNPELMGKNKNLGDSKQSNNRCSANIRGSTEFLAEVSITHSLSQRK